MAKYEVKCEKCGSKMGIVLFGKMDKREWIIENGTHICDSCKEKEQQERNAANALRNADMGLPALIGSEKQVAWAETIRAKYSEKRVGDLTGFCFQEKLKSLMQEASISVDDLAPYASQCKNLLKEAYEHLKQTASASWWINNRDDFKTPFAESVCHKMKEMLKK